MSDITLWDTVVAIEFASDCTRRADQNARACHWEAAGNWMTAGQIITELDGEKDDLEAALHTASQTIAALEHRLRLQDERVAGLERTIDGRDVRDEFRGELDEPDFA